MYALCIDTQKGNEQFIVGKLYNIKEVLSENDTVENQQRKKATIYNEQLKLKSIFFDKINLHDELFGRVIVEKGLKKIEYAYFKIHSEKDKPSPFIYVMHQEKVVNQESLTGLISPVSYSPFILHYNHFLFDLITSHSSYHYEESEQIKGIIPVTPSFNKTNEIMDTSLIYSYTIATVENASLTEKEQALVEKLNIPSAENVLKNSVYLNTFALINLFKLNSIGNSAFILSRNTVLDEDIVHFNKAGDNLQEIINLLGKYGSVKLNQGCIEISEKDIVKLSINLERSADIVEKAQDMFKKHPIIPEYFWMVEACYDDIVRYYQTKIDIITP